MNRRNFLKAAAAIPVVTITCEYKDDGKEPEKESKNCDWPYRLYCYEREQGEWTFTKNTRGSFTPEREYMTFEEDTPSRYAGWMDGGVLHFQTFDEAADFVEMHVRAKEDINLIDSIYDIYYRNVYHYDPKNVQFDGSPAIPTEYHIAHYWFNGDTGRQIHWEVDDVAELKDKRGRSYLVNTQTGEGLTDWSKVECS